MYIQYTYGANDVLNSFDYPNPNCAGQNISWHFYGDEYYCDKSACDYALLEQYEPCDSFGQDDPQMSGVVFVIEDCINVSNSSTTSGVYLCLSVFNYIFFIYYH